MLILAETSPSTVIPSSTGALILGVLMLVVARMMRKQVRRREDLVRLGLLVAGWCCVWLGLFVSVSGGLAFAVFIGLPALWYLIRSHLRGEDRAMCAALAGAARHEVPLINVFPAFPVEFGWRNAPTRAAEMADQGDSLSEIVHRVRIGSRSFRLAVVAGEQFHVLANSLSRWLEFDRTLLPSWQRIVARTVYLFAVSCFLPLLVVVLVTGLWRNFDYIASGLVDQPFREPVPLWLAQWIAAVSPFLVPAAFWTFSRWGWFLPVPGKRIVCSPRERIDLFSTLRAAMEAQQPIHEALDLVGEHGPGRRLRTRCRRAAAICSVGGNWIDSLADQAVISPADARMLRTAEQAGNLPWALEQMAASLCGHEAQAREARMGVAFPLAILWLAIPVALLAYTVFQWLITVITTLI